MRFAHLSDSHLGYRQLGILEREKDYYRLFQRTIDKIIELDVDFVVHSGDLFDNYRPSTESLLSFQEGLNKLNDAGIPFYAVVGNHDSRLRVDAKPPLVLFRELGVNLITTKKPFVYDDTLICGIPYTKSSNRDALLLKLEKLSELAENYPKSILLLHQGLKGYIYDESYELTLEELPKNFDYYAMGHIHNYHLVDLEKEGYFDGGILVYPGSMEMQNVRDDPQKGFCIVDMSGERPEVERVIMDFERKTYNIDITYDQFEDTIKDLKDEFLNLENPPIVDFSVNGGNFDTSDLYDRIHDELGDYVLNLRTHLDPTPIASKGASSGASGEPLDIRSVLYKRVNEIYDDENKARLSVDLLDELSVGNIEDAKALSNEFFNKNYMNIDENEPENKDDAPSGNLDIYFRGDGQ